MEKAIKTYEFSYDIPEDDFHSVQFCAYTRKEAEELFADYCKENGFAVPKHDVEIVYNYEDEQVYKAEGIPYYNPDKN